MRKRRVALIASMLIIFSAVTVFAGESSGEFADGLGYAKLRVNYANQMRDCEAYAYGLDNRYYKVVVTATYQDGSTYVKKTGPSLGLAEVTFNYEWVEDYKSVNTVHSSKAGYRLSTVYLAED